MRMIFGSAATVKLGGGLAAVLFVPTVVHACACGCGVFDVGTSSMFPEDPGGTSFLQYNYQDQNQNWSGSSTAPATDNDDKEIRTDSLTLGLQYMFNRNWGIQAEVPYAYRYFKKEDAGSLVTRNWNQLGDIRVEGIYTGFLADMAAGVTFGVKLPTGSFTFSPEVVDRDTQLGTGSTDLLLGGYYQGYLDRQNRWGWFTQAQLDLPVLTQDEYRPGTELDLAAGVDYKGITVGSVSLAPIAQVIATGRTSDSGANSASPVASGYQRILLSPGVEFQLGRVRLYADAEFPIYQHFTGNQLAAPVLFKMVLSFMF